MLKLLKNNDGGDAGYTENVSVSAGTYKLGAVLTAEGAIASGDVVGAYICAEGGESGKTIPSGGGKLIATAITDGMVFEVDKPDAEVTVGSSYQFNDKGTGIATTKGEDEAITANTATAGGVLVLSIDGDKVRVKINQ